MIPPFTMKTAWLQVFASRVMDAIEEPTLWFAVVIVPALGFIHCHLSPVRRIRTDNEIP